MHMHTCAQLTLAHAHARLHTSVCLQAEDYEACLFPSRIATFQRLLNEHPRFAEMIATDVRHLLHGYCENNAAEGLPAHVQLAMGDVGRMGTLRQALVTAISTVLHVAIATAVARIDRNFNLRVLASADTVPSSLWFTLSSVRDRTLSVMNATVDASCTVAVANDGLHGPHSCRFPFSHILISLLEEKRKELDLNLKSNAARMNSASEGSEGPAFSVSRNRDNGPAPCSAAADRLDGMLPLVLGQDVAGAVTEFFKSRPDAAFDACVSRSTFRPVSSVCWTIIRSCVLELETQSIRLIKNKLVH